VETDGRKIYSISILGFLLFILTVPFKVKIKTMNARSRHLKNGIEYYAR
jgi:hypothetical protein